MEFRRLGRSGLKVSEIAYGNWLTHGSQVEEETAIECVRAALDAGITTFDTADRYQGGRAETVLGPWDCVSCPANVIHGFVNVGLEPAYLQVMLGKARPDLMTYTDASLQQRRDEHLTLGPARRDP